MHPRVLASMDADGGLITRGVALRCGMSDTEIRRLLRRGEWTQVRTGVYAPGSMEGATIAER